MMLVAPHQRMFDGLAIGASTLCLVHCLVLPALILLLPALATILAVPEEFHLWALALAVPTSLFALASGHRRHGRRQPALAALPGLLLLALGALAAPDEATETWLTVAGSILLATGHAINWRATRHSPHPRKSSI